MRCRCRSVRSSSRLAHADRERRRAPRVGSCRGSLALAQGGTAVGTGINAHPQFGAAVRGRAVERDRRRLSCRPTTTSRRCSSQDTAVELSGQLKTTAVSLMKIANDLRWMNSGPLAGLGEIALPALQPGSSIMPGKVNPVIPEAAAMVAAQVIGNDATITIAGQSGNFQLNVMLPRDRATTCCRASSCWRMSPRAAGRLGDRRVQGQSGAARRGARAQSDPGHGAESGHRLREGRGDRQEGLRAKAARSARWRRRRRTSRPSELRSLLDPLELTKGGIKG